MALPWRSPEGRYTDNKFRVGSSRLWVTIVAVVGDIRQSGLEKPPNPEMYLPGTRNPTTLTGVAIWAKGDPKRLALAVRLEIRAVDQEAPVTGDEAGL